MRAYYIQKWLLYGLLLPLTLLNVVWWSLQMYLWCELSCPVLSSAF